MSRTKSIAGVRPLGWLARVRAQCSCLAWACAAQLLGGALWGWRQSRRWAWERATTMRVSARGQAKGGADGKAKLHAPEAGDRQRVGERSRARCSDERKNESKTSPFWQLLIKCMSQLSQVKSCQVMSRYKSTSVRAKVV
jgi:hypothetical protein